MIRSTSNLFATGQFATRPADTASPGAPALPQQHGALPRPHTLRRQTPFGRRLVEQARAAAPIPGDRDLGPELIHALRSKVFGALDSEVRTRLACEDRALIPYLRKDEIDGRPEFAEIKKAVSTIETWYLECKSAHASSTPWKDVEAFYWGNRAVLKGSPHEDVCDAFNVYHSTAALALVDAPALLYSRQRPEAALAAKRRHCIGNLPWNCYNPEEYANDHSYWINMFWVLGLHHNGLTAVMTVPLDPSTVVRKSAWELLPPALQNTAHNLAAYPREVLGLLQAGHYQACNDPDGIQMLLPRESAKRAAYTDLLTPAGMDLQELIRRLDAVNVDTRFLKYGIFHRDAETPVELQQDRLNRALKDTDALRDDARDLLADSIAVQYAHANHYMDDAAGIVLPRRDQLVQSFRTLVRRMRESLGTIDTTLSEDTREREVDKLLNQRIGVFIDTLEDLEEAAKILFDGDELEWLDDFFGAAQGVLDTIDARIGFGT